MSFNVDEPVCVGFSGKAGSGKTYTAKLLIPQQTFMYGDVEKFPAVVWDHYWFSAPLYEMANVKTTIEGVDQKNRKLYMLHEIISSLMSQRISYDDLIELVYDIYAMPCEIEGAKPRTFLTSASDLCKREYTDCFVDFVKRKVRNDYLNLLGDVERNDQEMPWYVAVISDVRYPSEALMVKNHPNSLLIKFETSEDVRNQRLMNRDGVTLTPTQGQHTSEMEFENIPDEWYDFIIDTDSLTLEEQTSRVYNILKEYLPLPELEVVQ